MSDRPPRPRRGEDLHECLLVAPVEQAFMREQGGACLEDAEERDEVLCTLGGEEQGEGFLMPTAEGSDDTLDGAAVLHRRHEAVQHVVAAVEEQVLHWKPPCRTA